MRNLAQQAADYAIYVPSMQFASAANIAGADLSLRRSGLPYGLKAADFNYLDPTNRYWHYHAALASAANFEQQHGRNAIAQRDECNLILGDSGGYQIGTGALSEIKRWLRLEPDEIIAKWRDSTIKSRFLSWLDDNSTLAMSIDMPLWVVGNEKSSFGKLTKQQLIDITRDNLDFMSRNRIAEGGCKILNVLQGKTEEDEQEWYDVVKDYPFDGWSLAGHVGTDGGLYRILRRILLLRDEGRLRQGKDWLHILKLSPCRWSPMLTQIQRAVRRSTGNKAFTITYDSSSPYKLAGTKLEYVAMPSFRAELDGWQLPKQQFPAGITAATRERETPLTAKGHMLLKAPLTSPIARKLKLGDMVREGRMKAVRVDRFSHEVLINHNVFTYVSAGIKANEIAFSKPGRMPGEMQEASKLIGELFKRERWMDLLQDSRKLLKRVKA